MNTILYQKCVIEALPNIQAYSRTHNNWCIDDKYCLPNNIYSIQACENT
jgi:hypothetical protein